MRGRLSISKSLLLFLILSITTVPTTHSKEVKSFAGSSCSKVGTKRELGGKSFTCSKNGKKKVWTLERRSKPIQTPEPIKEENKPSALPSIPLYTGGPGRTGMEVLEKSFELPITPLNAYLDFNVRLWLFDPRNKELKLDTPGMWFWTSGEKAKWVNANSDGSILAQWEPGYYSFGITANTTYSELSTRVYVAEIDKSGKLYIQGLSPNSIGFYTVTTDFKANVDDKNFQPANQCQLRGQDGIAEGNMGFPRRENRLPNIGTVRAIVIPVDFPDVQGEDMPAEAFFPITKKTEDYFKQVSSGKVKFEFQILENYLRMPFISTTHRLRNEISGDSPGFWRDVIFHADNRVDFSKFDVVYVMTPKSIPRRSIVKGPAMLSKVWTNDGIVTNGSYSGSVTFEDFPTIGWKWMAHETGHFFGLPDLYTFKGPTFGSWDIMEDAWSEEAIELSAWNRYILGWLDEEEITCSTIEEITSSEQINTLSPLALQNNGIRAQLVRLSADKILVAELRTNAGLDSIKSENEGVLVYTVDMKIRSGQGGWKVIRRAGSVAGNFSDATLKKGDVVQVDGIAISVTQLNSESATIKLSKTN